MPSKASSSSPAPRRRRLPPPPRDYGPDRMYWPGRVAPGFDPVVPAADVHAVCAERMAAFDALPRAIRDRINDDGVVR